MNVIQIEFWQLIGMGGSIVVVLCGAGWTLIKVIVAQFNKRLDEKFVAQEELRAERDKALNSRFKALETQISREGEGWRKVERELLELKSELPLQYMRREDAIRQEVVIHAKLDALAAKIDGLKAEAK